MAEPPAKPATTAAAGETDAIAALRNQLADRDRRLAELTEHSLRILDELARERAEAGDRQVLRAQNARLQELLADTRSRVRQSANVVVAAPLPAAPFEVVSWGVDDLDDKRLQRQVEACGGVSITVLAGDEAPGLALALPPRSGLAVLQQPGPTPAVAFNTGMAATQAAVVVFLWGGTRLPEEALARLAGAAAAEGVAMAVPLVQIGKQRWSGQSIDEHLRGARLPAQKAKAPIGEVPFALPEAFAIARSAFAATGAFDQDLRTDVALIEWLLRAKAAAMRVVVVRDAVAEAVGLLADRLAAADADGLLAAGDRLIALARHRPAQVTAALLASPAYWTLPPDELAERFAAVLRRLPTADGNAIAIDLLVQQARSLVQQAVPAPVLRQHLEQLERILDVTLDLGASHYPAALRRVVDQVHVSVRGAGDQLQATLERLQREVEAEREAKGHLQQLLGERQAAIAELQGAVDELRGEVSRCQGAIREQKDEIIRRDGALLAAKDALAATERRTADVARELAGKAAEITAVVRAHDELLRDRDDLRQHARNLEESLRHARAHAAELEPAAARVAAERDALAGRLTTAELGLADARRRGEDAERRVAELEQALAAESSRLETMIGDLGRYRSDLEDTRTDRERLAAKQHDLGEQCRQLDARVRDALKVLADREQWIVTLLQEVGKRRWRPRALADYEQQFLAAHRRQP
ncbi:MAG: hypothetical protein IPK26_01755 [Planctomycetes bacterium]|nr:hypothetical protein [Planctomycetota bacterium]